MHLTEAPRVMRAARNGLATLLLPEILTIVIAAPPQTAGGFARLDPAFDALVPKNAQVEKLAGDSRSLKDRSGVRKAPCGSAT